MLERSMRRKGNWITRQTVPNVTLCEECWPHCTAAVSLIVYKGDYVYC